jgi:D-3-phosphoglycerate dehydrogenase
MKLDIFVALSTFSEFDAVPLNLLKESGLRYSLNTLGHRLNQQEIIKLAAEARGIIAGVEPYDSYVLENLPNLKCISRCGVGFDNIDIAKAKEKGIIIKNTPDVVVQPVAELTIAMIFDLLRKLTEQTVLMKEHRWSKISGNMLSGRKIGILGLGRIGKKVAEMLVTLGGRVWGTDIVPDVGWAKKKKVQIVSFEELLRECDIISVHISPSESDKFILGKEQIQKMKQGTLVINTSRGSLIDEEALYEGLKSGQLGGAALDVFSKEPYDGILCRLNNVILTPHIATLTRESRTEMEIEAVKNLLEYLNQPL